MNIKRIRYKMDANEDWKVGYMIGEYDGQNKTLLDEKFNYVPKIISEGKEFSCYDMRNDSDKILNLTINV